jgi:small subunit ribosomal protein S16
MAVKIRLTRLGKKKQPTYRVVVMDSRKARDGQYIEQLGFYDPRQEPSVIDIDNERAVHWLTTGAQPTERAQKLLEISGAWTQFKVAKGEIHTVGGAEPKKASKPKAEPAPVPVVAAETAEASPEADAAPSGEHVAEDVAVEAAEESPAAEAAAEPVEDGDAS